MERIRAKKRKKARVSQSPAEPNGGALAVEVAPVDAGMLERKLNQISLTLEALVSKVDGLSNQLSQLRREPTTALAPQSDVQLADKCRTTVRKQMGELVQLSGIPVGKSRMAHFGQMDLLVDQAFVVQCFEKAVGESKFSSKLIEKTKQKGMVDNVCRALADKYAQHTHCTFAVMHFYC